MPRKWLSPLYKLRSTAGKDITIDVTLSVSPGLGPSKVLMEKVVPFLRRRGVQKVIDFGAGALRHTLPLLQSGFEVCAVDFQSGFQRPACAVALEEARKYPLFCELVWPADFLDDSRRWDAALLCYVLQTMPIPAERQLVLKTLRKKLKADSYVIYMSRYNQLPPGIKRSQRVSDGYYMYPKREAHTFYREFSTQDTHDMMKRFGLNSIRWLSDRGTDQMFLYAKGKGTFI